MSKILFICKSSDPMKWGKFDLLFLYLNEAFYYVFHKYFRTSRINWIPNTNSTIWSQLFEYKIKGAYLNRYSFHSSSAMKRYTGNTFGGISNNLIFTVNILRTLEESWHLLLRFWRTATKSGHVPHPMWSIALLRR